jgi:hypothetical protein
MNLLADYKFLMIFTAGGKMHFQVIPSLFRYSAEQCPPTKR